MNIKFLLFFLFLGINVALAQRSVSNVRTRAISKNRIEIQYNLDAIQSGDSVYFQIESRFGGALAVNKDFVSGDTGNEVEPGINKKIIWRAGENGYKLNGEVRATVFIKPAGYIGPVFPQSTTSTVALQVPDSGNFIKKSYQTSLDTSTRKEPTTNLSDSTKTRKKRAATWSTGPGWALVSAVLPGVGNMFVQTNNAGKPVLKVGLRPLATIGFYGLLVYGIQQRTQSQNAYEIYEQQKNAAEGESYYQKANQLHHRYYLATRAAAAIWATDVALTLIRGIRNSKRKAALKTITFSPGMQAGQVVGLIRVRL